MAYIEREKAIDEIDKWLDSVGYVTVGKGLTSYGELIGCLEDTPTADVVEVRRGQWQKHYKSGTTVSDGFVSSCCDMWNERETPYCPHCGAKMDGKDGE